MKDLAYYLALPYTRKVDKREGEAGVYYIASIAELPWVQIHGSDPVEAKTKLDDLFEDAIEALLDAGDEIPEPELWPASVGVFENASKPRRVGLFKRKYPPREVPTVSDSHESPWTEAAGDLRPAAIA